MTREQNLLHSSKVKSISFDQKQENLFYYKIFFEGNEYQVTLTNYLAIEIISNVSKLFNEPFSRTFNMHWLRLLRNVYNALNVSTYR